MVAILFVRSDMGGTPGVVVCVLVVSFSFPSAALHDLTFIMMMCCVYDTYFDATFHIGKIHGGRRF